MTPSIRAALEDLQVRARPAQSFNPGVASKLVRDGLVRSVQLPSPYPTHRGKDIEHLAITAQGVDALRAAGHN